MAHIFIRTDILCQKLLIVLKLLIILLILLNLSGKALLVQMAMIFIENQQRHKILIIELQVLKQMQQNMWIKDLAQEQYIIIKLMHINLLEKLKNMVKHRI